MANNYFLCAVSGKGSCRRGHREERLAFLELCKTDNAFFLEKRQAQGSFEKVKQGDIIFLTFQQKLVAYGAVKGKRFLFPSREINGFEFRDEGISVIGWDGWLDDEDDWIDIGSSIEGNTSRWDPQSAKVKEITNLQWALWLIEKINEILK